MTRMRQTTLGLFAAVLLLAMPGSVFAQDTTDLTGTWDISVESPDGMSFQMTWTLEQHEDGTVSGKSMAPEIGEAEIVDGWIDGDSFGFSMYVEAQGEAFDVLYEGNFTAEEVYGSLDVGGGMFTADFTGLRADGGVR